MSEVNESETAAGPARDEPQLISIVVPMFNEQANVDALIDEINSIMDARPYELILVDDGSTDGTARAIEARAAEDSRIVGLCLSRNFGHQYALAAGLKFARGDVVVMMDGDLQHPPQLLPSLIEKWREGFNIVQAKRTETDGASASKRNTSKLYYKIFRFLCGIELEEGMADFRLLDRTVVDEINKIQEGQLFLRGLIAWMGYRRAVVEFKAPARQAGKSKYGLRQMLHLAGSGMLSFSPAPMRLGIVVGLVMSALSFLELLYVLLVRAFGATVPGWASTVGLLSLVFGVMFLLMGLQGEYLIRIYQRVQHRPAFLVERVIGQGFGETKTDDTQKDDGDKKPPPLMIRT